MVHFAAWPLWLLMRCGVGRLIDCSASIVQALAWGALRCLGFWLYESLAHWLVAAQLRERCPQKIRRLPRSGVVTIMKLLLLAVLRFTTGCNRLEADSDPQ
jgi:hypothetical protein